MDSPRALSSTRMPRRASQVPRLILRHPPPSITPGGPAGASARFFPPGCRLHPIRKVGHRHLSATRPNQVHLRWGSCLHRQGRITPPRLLAYCRGNRPTPRAWLPSAGGRNYMVNEQLPWLTPFQSTGSARLGLAYPDLHRSFSFFRITYKPVSSSRAYRGAASWFAALCSMPYSSSVASAKAHASKRSNPQTGRSLLCLAQRLLRR